ncbi:hypothetical protein B0H14DRAFT_2602789 [Mycena olivaceomarginata]|nr:hypothetical protein B0H14DRAFT_2602789 [Mycena olivaceomarginata]
MSSTNQGDGMSIGFDVEWTADNEPGAKRKTRVGASEAARFADILGKQIIYLIDLPAIMGKEIPHELERVCASSAINKAGTGIFFFQARISRGDETLCALLRAGGPRRIAEHSQRESDWSKKRTNIGTTEYAVTDTYASFECYPGFSAKSTDANTTYPVLGLCFDVVAILGFKQAPT